MALLVVALVVLAPTPTLLGRPLVRVVPVAKVHHRVPRLHPSVPRVTPTVCDPATNPRMGPAVSSMPSLVLLLWSDIDPAATANTIAASGRSRRARRDVECEFPYERCAIPGLGDSYECVNVQSDVESCGGCTGAGGMDCTSISNTLAADCRDGSCVIRTSPRVFILEDRRSCLHPRFLRPRFRRLDRPQVVCTKQLPPLYR